MNITCQYDVEIVKLICSTVVTLALIAAVVAVVFAVFRLINRRMELRRVSGCDDNGCDSGLTKDSVKEMIEQGIKDKEKLMQQSAEMKAREFDEIKEVLEKARELDDRGINVSMVLKSGLNTITVAPGHDHTGN